MIEIHPFDEFVPQNCKFLLLGSFVGRQAFRGSPDYDHSYDWYYGTRKNQFWPILEQVYGIPLGDKNSKQALFFKLKMAITDIVKQCERKEGNNLDTNLFNILYNVEAIRKILESYGIKKIYFTSRFVEKRFKSQFKDILKRYPDIDLVTLPSPSPRYARISKEQKISLYRELLPILPSLE